MRGDGWADHYSELQVRPVYREPDRLPEYLRKGQVAHHIGNEDRIDRHAVRELDLKHGRLTDRIVMELSEVGEIPDTLRKDAYIVHKLPS